MSLPRGFLQAGNWLLTTHILISLTAVALAVETCMITQQKMPAPALLGFLFFSTHFAYNVYYIKGERGKEYKLLAAISLLVCAVLLLYIPTTYYPWMAITGIGSAIYVAPVFARIPRGKSYTFQKLLLLVFVWVAATFMLPYPDFEPSLKSMLYLLHRVLLLVFTCLLFFVRDETDEQVRIKALAATLVSLVLLCCMAVLVMSIVHVVVGMVYCLIALLCLLIAFFFLSKKFPNTAYLLVVDGVMLLQSAIIVGLHMAGLL